MHKLLKEEPTPPSVINVHVPPAFDAVITKALAKRPENRYQTGAEFIAAIESAAGQPMAAGVHDEPMIVDTATIALTPPTRTAPAAPPTAATKAMPAPAPQQAVKTPPPHSSPSPRPSAPSPLPTAKAKSNTGALAILVGLLVVSAAALWWWLMGMPMPFASRPATAEPPPASVSSPPVSVPDTPTPATAKLGLSVRPTSGREQFRPGETIVLDIVPSRDAHIYCFMQDESGAIARFFPNRFATGSRVPASGIRVPGEGQFAINANARGAREEIACYASDTDILGQVTATIGNGDIDKPVTVGSLGDLDKVFFTAGGATLGVARLPIQPR